MPDVTEPVLELPEQTRRVDISISSYLHITYTISTGGDGELAPPGGLRASHLLPRHRHRVGLRGRPGGVAGGGAQVQRPHYRHHTAGVCRDQVQGVAWQWEGALLATEAKDRTVRVFDPR